MPERIRLLLLSLPVLLLAAWAFSPEPAPSDGRVHIQYWEKWTSFEGDAMRAVVDRFNQRQNRVFVEYLAVSQVDQKMLLATAGGDPPDVAGLWAFNVHVYADNGSIRPLDDLCARDGIGPENYLPCYWELGRHRGRTWVLPTTPATVALHWNKRHFREAGLDPERPPRTLAELDAVSERLTIREGDHVVRMGFMPSEPNWWSWAWGYWFGGDLWDGQARIIADAPENVRAYEWVQSYARKYGSRSLNVFQSGFGNFDSPLNAFIAGKVSMVCQGVWMNNFVRTHNPSMEWGAAPFPHPDDRPDLARSTVVDMDVLAIPTGARHPEQAWEFIKYVQSHEGMELLCLGQRKHSPLSTMTPGFADTHPHPYLRLFYDLARSGRTFHTPRVGIWREYQDEMKTAFEEIWTNGVEPSVALQRARERMQPKLDHELERARRRGWTATLFSRPAEFLP